MERKTIGTALTRAGTIGLVLGGVMLAISFLCMPEGPTCSLFLDFLGNAAYLP